MMKSKSKLPGSLIGAGIVLLAISCLFPPQAMKTVNLAMKFESAEAEDPAYRPKTFKYDFLFHHFKLPRFQVFYDISMKHLVLEWIIIALVTFVPAGIIATQREIAWRKEKQLKS